VFSLVPEDMRAWHAGAGEWAGCRDVNSASIGIELDNDGTHPFAHPQMRALEGLLPDIMSRWDIAPAGVIGHSDMAPDRKQDPGPRFDWSRLARQGLAQRSVGAGREDAALSGALDHLGYPDCAPDLRLAAFRLRHRPWGQGPEAPEDRALADALAQTLAT
jgi:N-acetylmuramoyl-L-alanine amidase